MLCPDFIIINRFLFSFPRHSFRVFAVFQILFIVRKAPTDFYNLQSFFQSVLPKFLLFTHTLIFDFQN